MVVIDHVDVACCLSEVMTVHEWSRLLEESVLESTSALRLALLYLDVDLIFIKVVGVAIFLFEFLDALVKVKFASDAGFLPESSWLFSL